MAVRRTTVVDFGEADEAARAELRTQLAAASSGPDILESWARPTMAGTVRGGDLIWHVAFADVQALDRWTDSAPARQAAQALSSSLVGDVTSATYEEGRSAYRDVAGERPVHRTLLLRALADDATVARFEDELFAMGELIPVMRLWRLSRVRESTGAVPWTHVWEQVFADPVGLERAYMRHPYHWGHVDRWFDGESPEKIVTTDFCHTFCRL